MHVLCWKQFELEKEIQKKNRMIMVLREKVKLSNELAY